MINVVGTTSKRIFLAIATILLLSSDAQWSVLSTNALSPASVTDAPPLVDVPVWSMATINENDDNNKTPTTNMNLLTYATPVSIRPDRLYAIGLYKITKSRENFIRSRTCILQLLSDTEEHISCVRLLGGCSGADISKEEKLSQDLEIDLLELDGDEERLPKVLPGCDRYLKLTMIGEAIDCDDNGEGSHDVVLCRVDKIWKATKPEAETSRHLSTGKLRSLGLITDQGRIAPLPHD